MAAGRGQVPPAAARRPPASWGSRRSTGATPAGRRRPSPALPGGHTRRRPGAVVADEHPGDQRQLAHPPPGVHAPATAAAGRTGDGSEHCRQCEHACHRDRTPAPRAGGRSGDVSLTGPLWDRCGFWARRSRRILRAFDFLGVHALQPCPERLHWLKGRPVHARDRYLHGVTASDAQYRWTAPEPLVSDVVIVPLTRLLLDLDLAAYCSSPRAIRAHSAGRWPTENFTREDDCRLI